MKKLHPKYKIKKGDTIDLITKHFGIPEDTWKQYHNNMCSLTDIIRKKMPSDLEEIYLSPELWGRAHELNSISNVKGLPEQKTHQNIAFGFQNTLPMRACPHELNYAVMLVFFKNEKVNTLKYKICIRWIDKDQQKHIIEISNRSDIYINNKQVDFTADELAVKVSSALYPLELVVTREDGIVAVNNFTAIQSRWEQVKLKIRDYYAGDTLEKYLRLNDIILKDQESFLESLQNDFFLHAYFNKIYKTYGETYSLSNKLYVPFLFDTKGVEYTVKQEIDKQVNPLGFIQIRIQGEVTDKRSILDLVNKQNSPMHKSQSPLSGNYSALYTIEPNYHTISKLELESSLNLIEKKRIKVTVTQLK